MFRKILLALYILVIVMVLAMPALSDTNPQLSLTKSFSQTNIEVNGSTEVIITVEHNSGGDAKNIIIVDTVPYGFESMSGQNTVTFDPIPALKSGENRTVRYTIKATRFSGEGNHEMTDATATYQDVEGNSHPINSKTTPRYIYVNRENPKTPGFEVVLAGIGVLIALVLRRNNR